ncbi:uncharacterized protein LOC127213761 [Phodopus roborovskii]|uniref:uncharacterized protein LOC127213761 n=1 Tax=Phodopus roborovskii TaxID=109678 RepID=UPI0021E3934C|nr:uncharacterized protein LOC127213761 [Phodopus roborovskii]
MASDSTIDFPDLLCSWEEDRKLVLRGWSLVFIFLATLLVFSVVDGRMAYVHGPYTGFIGLWIDCRRHKCANVGQVTGQCIGRVSTLVYIHMSKGFIFLALALCLVLLPTMFLSFRPVCRRLNKIDFVFSFLSISIGLLILLSLTLFIINCDRLRPRPQVSYLLAFYLCWCASVLMLWAGALSFLNQLRLWTYTTPLVERRVSYFRWASRRLMQLQPISDHSLESTQNQCAAIPSSQSSVVPGPKRVMIRPTGHAPKPLSILWSGPTQGPQEATLQPSLGGGPCPTVDRPLFRKSRFDVDVTSRPLPGFSDSIKPGRQSKFSVWNG